MSDKHTRPIDARVIALDETSDWREGIDYDIKAGKLPKDFWEFIERIESVYLYDNNSHTYCCELTPSYWLEWIETRAIFKSPLNHYTSSSFIDKVEDYILEGGGPPNGGHYYHVYTIDSLAARVKPEPFRYLIHGDTGVSYEETAYDEQIESLVEHFRANTPL